MHTTKWNCKYRIMFASKYKRKVFYKEKRAERGKIPRTLCEWKNIKDRRSRGVTGSRTYAARDTAESIGIQLHGVLEEEEQLNDL